jgi:hypothetical protein
VQFEYLPMIHAATALQSGSATKALAPAAPYELGSIGGVTLYPVYLRGQAYLAAHQGSAAAAEFQKTVDHPGVHPTFAAHSLAKLGLGRAYVLTGDAAKARAEYQDFLALWKDADPDIPILKQAQAEYAKLNQRACVGDQFFRSFEQPLSMWGQPLPAIRSTGTQPPSFH